jgi:hypothetical protein
VPAVQLVVEGAADQAVQVRHLLKARAAGMRPFFAGACVDALTLVCIVHPVFESSGSADAEHDAARLNKQGAAAAALSALHNAPPMHFVFYTQV